MIENYRDNRQLNRLKEKTLAQWDHINRMAYRRFASESLAEEAALYVINSLEKNNWQKLASFQGKSSFQTYISSITFRLLEDFSRRKFGRLRPPLWIRKLGGIWTLLYAFLCLERLNKTEAVESVFDRMQTAQHKEIEEAATHLLEEITDCGSHQSLEVPLDEVTISDTSDNEPHAPQEQLEGKEKELFLTALFTIPSCSKEAKKLHLAVTKFLGDGLSLVPEERLLLKLCYYDEMRVTDAGRLLGLNRHQVHGRLRRLLNRLRNDIINMGVDEELLQMLEE